MASVISLFAPLPAWDALPRAASKPIAASPAEQWQLRCVIAGHDLEEQADDSFNRWYSCSRCRKVTAG